MRFSRPLFQQPTSWQSSLDARRHRRTRPGAGARVHAVEPLHHRQRPALSRRPEGPGSDGAGHGPLRRAATGRRSRSSRSSAGTCRSQAVSPHLIAAIVAIEDQRFYDHGGVDLVRIAGAGLANLREGRRAQGGSTLTQQLARQSFLTLDKTFRRKVQEALLAMRIEREYTQGADPRALPEQDVLRRGSVRRGSGRARLLRQVRARSHGGRSRRCWPDSSSRRPRWRRR